MIPASQEIGSLARRICDRKQWPPEEFVERAFWACIPPVKKPFVRIVHALSRKPFAADYDVLEEAFTADSMIQVEAAASSLRHDPRRKFNFLRDLLGLRISGHLLLRMLGRVAGVGRSHREKPVAPNDGV
ncbi:MAG: hypothetical protein EXS36_02995 [Pedosphaera sp.]|nr:hypothetical protein [Pedosphaera sp.]